jgi:RNA polymerase sigma-70 factor (ECF subfamily)
LTDANVNKGEGSAQTSLSLLDRARRQAPGAWEQLVSLYAPLVYGWCRRAGLRPDDAEDVGQEVFCAVARKLGEFHRDRPGDSFRGWLWRITDHKIGDYRRQHPAALEAVGGSEGLRRVGGLADEGPDTSASDPAGAPPREDKVLLHQALQQLRPEFSEQVWQAFWRVTVESRVPAAVARELGVSTNVVYLAKSRVLRRLREEFAGLLENLAPEEPRS